MNSAWKTPGQIIARPGGLLEGLRRTLERRKAPEGRSGFGVLDPFVRSGAIGVVALREEARRVRCDKCGADWCGGGRGVHGLHVTDQRCEATGCGLYRMANCKNELLQCACGRGGR